jgi:hypothetical protein
LTEKAPICVEKCSQTVRAVEYSIAKSGVILEDKYHQSIGLLPDYSLTIEKRVENILKVRRIRALSYDSENDLGEKVWELSAKKIEPRWHGESMTASDLFFSFNDKKIMIQDKATKGESFQVSSVDLTKLLSDSMAYGHYPALSISFENNKVFTHYIVPIEEIMSLISKKSVTFSKEKLRGGTVRALSTEEFVNTMLDCSFPSMKFDRKQFEVWLNRLNS